MRARRTEQRASRRGRRCATAEQLPTAMPARRPRGRLVDVERRRHHRDRDHEVAAAAELEEGARGRVPRACGTWTATTSSPRAQRRAAAAEDESASGRRRAPARSGSSTSASSASKAGTPSAAGEALQRLPATVPAFWICTPPTSRAAAFRPSNSGGSSASMQVAPGRRGADPPALASAGCRAGRRCATMSSTSSSIACADVRRIEIGAAGQHRMRPSQAPPAPRQDREDGDRHPIVRVRTIPQGPREST